MFSLEVFQKIHIATVNIACGLFNNYGQLFEEFTKVASWSSAIMLKENIRENMSGKKYARANYMRKS